MSQKWYLSSKLHKAIVTQACLDYEGSITIDRELCEAVGLEEFEKVLVVSNTSGARLETYVIYGVPGSKTICMNGAAAHLIKTGEEIIIMGFSLASHKVLPQQALLNTENKIVRKW